MKKLIKLIQESKSMESDVIRQERITLLQFMKPEHKKRLKDILTREKKVLAEIQKEYDKKAKKIINLTINK
jgi:hypothetical protein